ncbi:MAG: cobalamin-dependent protein [Tissierellales bacterium]|nr:cobalamin-dependent protein [Tissierellales bacterium]MBN2828282.1 cobalamin-dependent protein [Tissierellales bacterium]
MNILLIRPKPENETIGLKHVMICEPLELEYIAGNITLPGASVTIIDMILEKKPLDYFIRELKPDIVGITGYITHVNVIQSYGKMIKEINPNTVVVVGGVHGEVVGEDFLTDEIDYVVQSYPVQTFNRIIESVAETAPDKTSARKPIEGTYQIGMKCNQESSFFQKPPDRLKTEKYRSQYYYMFHNPCALIKTSFGCPYSCSFCFCKEITGGRYYERSIASVIEELQTIPENEIYIVDDDFLFSRERLIEFCKALDLNDIHKRYLVYGRADFIANNEDIISLLKLHGLQAVIVGFESYREEDLDIYNKKSSIEENEKAAEVLRRNGVEIYATLILPMDFTKRDFNRLCQWIKKLGIMFVNLQPLTPLPGTEIFNQYEKELLIDRKDYAKWDLAHLALKPQKMSIRAYYFQIIKLYYRVTVTPANVIKMIKKYGFAQVIKLSRGSSQVTWQYWKKWFKG